MLSQLRAGAIALACLGVFAASADAQTPTLKLSRNPAGYHLDLNGDAGAEYWVHASTNLANRNSWKFVTSMSLSAGGNAAWDEAALPGLKYRFFRASKFDPQLDRQSASNFRLIDHAGRTRELFYDSTASAVVLVFIAKDCPSTPSILAATKALRDKFAAQKVNFWILDPETGDLRDSLAAQASTLGLNLPFIQDQWQLVAQEFGITTSSEVVAIDPGSWQVFYRGAIQANATPGNLLDTALTQFLTNVRVSPSRTGVDGCDLGLPAPLAPSYAREIAPLLQARCVRCHSEGNIGSWVMKDYDVVKNHAASIKDRVLAGEMPPWHADPKYGKFSNDYSLTQDETRKLVDWVRAGAPRGEEADPLVTSPAPPAVAWELGQPDAILKIPPQSIKATGIEKYRYLNVTVPFTTNVWLRAAVVRPGNRRVVHHCLVLDNPSFAPGIDGFFAGYVPGMDPVMYPADTGKFIAAGTTLVFQMHYTTDGQAETDQTELGLYLMAAPPKYSLQTKSTYNFLFNIPPGAPDYQVSSSFTFNKKSVLFEMSPHMHLRGSRFRYDLRYPDGRTETILSVPHYEFHWQTLYRLAEPKQIPAGTVLTCTGAFDNSPQNTENPDPSRSVTFGEQTADEMFIGYFNYIEVP